MSNSLEPTIPLTVSDLPDTSRRQWVQRAGGLALLLSVFPVTSLGAKRNPSILGVRIWPSDEYTRVTLEYDRAVQFTQFMLENPDRLVVDVEGVEFNKVLEGLAGKVAADDPYIKTLRAGRFKPGVVRLVMELKTKAAPEVFTLKPAGSYGYRLVLDVYPKVPVDPLLALIENKQGASEKLTDKSEKSPKPAVSTGEQGQAPAVQTSKKSALLNRLVTLALDPGHGGEDPGAVGKGGALEKNITLTVARRLQQKIEAEPNMRAVLTRDSDFFVPLGHRVQKARRVKADLFVSIHADAWIKPEARGSSVFILSEGGASSSAARWLAQKENAADLIGGVNIGVKDPVLAKTLLDLSMTATGHDSMKLARAVLGELGSINTLHKAAVEKAAFAVLKAPDIPSILVETAFISNPEEEKKLVNEAYQDKLAEAILTGIKAYFAKNPPGPKVG